MHASQLDKTVGKNKTPNLHPPLSMEGPPYVVPLWETAENYLKEVKGRSAELGPKVLEIESSPTALSKRRPYNMEIAAHAVLDFPTAKKA